MYNEGMTIKELRKSLGLTQMQLALKLKVDTGTISRWERDLYRPRKAVSVRLNRLIKRLQDNGNKNGGNNENRT